MATINWKQWFRRIQYTVGHAPCIIRVEYFLESKCTFLWLKSWLTKLKCWRRFEVVHPEDTWLDWLAERYCTNNYLKNLLEISASVGINIVSSESYFSNHSASTSSLLVVFLTPSKCFNLLMYSLFTLSMDAPSHVWQPWRIVWLISLSHTVLLAWNCASLFLKYMSIEHIFSF